MRFSSISSFRSSRSSRYSTGTFLNIRRTSDTFLPVSTANEGLAPWIWTATILSIAAAITLLTKTIRERKGLLAVVCLAVIVSVWIDKGLGLIIPGFIPSPLGTVTEYHPTLTEVLITVGIGSVGLLVVSILYKVVIGVRDE